MVQKPERSESKSEHKVGKYTQQKGTILSLRGREKGNWVVFVRG